MRADDITGSIAAGVVTFNRNRPHLRNALLDVLDPRRPPLLLKRIGRTLFGLYNQERIR